eukprot:5659885-Pyramimonas_sp.AAC.1
MKTTFDDYGDDQQSGVARDGLQDSDVGHDAVQESARRTVSVDVGVRHGAHDAEPHGDHQQRGPEQPGAQSNEHSQHEEDEQDGQEQEGFQRGPHS